MQYLFVGLLGLAVGSFLNSVLFRMEKGKSAFVGHSSCPQCNHALAWYDLIPLLSFVFLQGKCRYCKQKISLQYPLVELATATLFVLLFWHLSLGFDWSLVIGHWSLVRLVYLLVITSLLIALFVYDLKHYILPDKILLPAIGIIALYHILNFVISHWDLIRNLELEIRNFTLLINPFASALGTAFFFFLIYALSKGRAMGFGDVKLAFFLGLFLGWPNILVALFFAFFLGAAVGIFLVLSSKKKWKSQVPFGPFLITGTFIALFWSQTFLDWYLHLVLV